MQLDGSFTSRLSILQLISRAERGVNVNVNGGGLQPLVPQQTGPPPPVRFGVTEGAKKLAPQPTGRRANLAHASKCFSLIYRSRYAYVL